MTNPIRVTFAIILFLFSCKNDNPITTAEIDNKDSSNDNRHAKKPRRYYYDYDTSKTDIENFEDGYVDTFSVNGSRFQFLSNPNSVGEFEVLVMKNGQWVNNLNAGYAVYGSNANQDINEDGLNDFVWSFLHGNEVYLFNDTVKQFCKKPIYIAHDWSVIDSAKKLYSNNYTHANYWQTDLFLLKDLNQTLLYNAVIDLHTDSMKEPGYLRLYKLKNGKRDDTTLVGHSQFDNLYDKFDYKAYWRRFAKRNIR